METGRRRILFPVSTHVVVIGGGLVGLGTARALLRGRPGLTVTILEKEPELGTHQSTHNSGVLHSGLYYAPGSAKARLAVRGIRTMSAYCAEHGVAHEHCGKLVVALDDAETARLRTLFERGTANGVRGLEWLAPEAAQEIEPHVRCVAAVRVPDEGIVDFRGVVGALERELIALGATIHTHAHVVAIRPQASGWVVRTTNFEVGADYLIACAGLHADRVAAMAGERPTARIVPFRGDYFQLVPGSSLVRHLIYPVPNPAFPFLGVHFTRMIRGGVECGPNAVLALSREGYRGTRMNAREAVDALANRGLWRFLARYPRMSCHEMARSMSKRMFTRTLQRLIPALREHDLRPGGSGVRAQAMLPDGTLVQDFLFVERATAFHVLNAPSPAATASLAIGEEIAARVLARR